jgi:hypothetical protein
MVISVFFFVRADEGVKNMEKVITPLRIDQGEMAGLDLRPGTSPMPDENVLSGKLDVK